MSLLEPEEEDRSGVEFDKDSKIRLFETQKRETEGSYGYLKKFLPVVAVAIILMGVVIWLMQPGIGSAVKPPKEVEDSVYQYMDTKEHRSVREITFYNCGNWYWVKILAEPRSYPPSLLQDPVNQFRLRVDRNGDTASSIQTLPLPDSANDLPCK
jgi:hypothetical protein